MKLNKVALFAAFIGLATWIFADVLVLRPNRLAAGEGLTILEVVATGPALVILFLWLIIPASDFLSPKNRTRNAFLAAAALAIAHLWIAGSFANKTIGVENPYARISLGTGLWLTLLAAVTIMIDAFKRLHETKIVKWSLITIAVGSVTAIFASGHLDQLSIMQEFANRKDKFWAELLAHLQLAFGSVAMSTVIGIPLGILAFKKPSIQRYCFGTLNILQTIPSIALFGMLMMPLALLASHYDWLQEIGFQGIGWAPAVIALTVYALLPIVRNTHAGLKIVDPDIVNAAVGMGMSGRQVLWRIEMPLALSVLLGGVRISLIQSIGLTAVAALIGAGGFGAFIFQGLGQAAEDLVLLGAIPTILMAIVVDFGFQGLVAVTKARGH